ncbi:MAG: BREX-3 system P-loop-containing protein BrxF, partial [Proteobacteria bacterium]|nr:BREX-3 system P-loop-containing protein BrxF [Pseudomonadota bacterium]
QDPLRLLQGLSRNKTVVASWNGAIIDGFLTYAEPAHPEYRRYPVHDFLVTNPETTT